MKRLAGGMVAVLSLVFAGSALASPPSSMQITSVIAFPSNPTGAPWKQSYAGTYTTSTGDSGTLAADAVFGAVPTGSVGQSPPNSVLQTRMTLTSTTDSTSTLVLRCTQHATAADFLRFPIVPSTGSCAVLSATGGYAGLNGSGRITYGVADFSAKPYPTVTDTVALG